MNKLKIENVVFCETIRPELGGKYSLLGAFAPELTIPLEQNTQLPVIIPIALFITGVPSSIGKFVAELRVLDVDGNQIVGGKVNGDFSVISVTSLVLGTMPLPIVNSGEYVFEWTFDENSWDRIGTLKIIFSRSDAPTPNPTS